MDSERWQQVQELLADLLETPSSAREAMLVERCGEDLELRREVESLLAAAEDSGDLLGGIAERAGLESAGSGDLAGGPDTRERHTDSAEIGETISHYRVDGVLGRGGMGEVYRATDVRLGRQVAMKMLPRELTRDPEHVARFKREARLLASLNHPNVAAIYDVDESGPRKVLILELVEGPTLADRIRSGGGAGLSMETTLSIALQIADAVEAAHDIGIVHRDLKPANVKVAARDRIKVLDFGIAKPEWGVDDTGAMRESATAPAPDVTAVGRVMGTAAYMSPEQARGERVDRRTDIWAFGCLFYEMLTGSRAIDATEPQRVRELVLNPEIDWSRLPADTPLTVRRLLERCLCVDPRRRLQAIGEARIALQRVLAGEVDEAAGIEPPPARTVAYWWAAFATGAAVAAVAAVAVWIWMPAAPTAAPTAIQRLQLTAHEAGGSPRISPDGSRIVYTQQGQLWVYPLDSVFGRAIPGVEGVYNPTWSPDGQELAYGFNGRMWRVGVDGGEPAVVGELPAGPAYMAWGPADRIVVAGAEGIFAMAPSGGQPELIMPLAEDEELVFDVAAAPGDAILFASGDRDRIDVWKDGRRSTLIESEGALFRRPHWVRSGAIVYLRAGTSPGIWAVPVDEQLRVTGPAVLVEPAPSLPTVSQRGHIVFVRDAKIDGQLVRVSRRGEAEPIPTPSQPGLFMPTSLPGGDGAIVVARETGVGKLWLHSLDGSASPRPLTFDLDAYDRYPEASPSGHLMVYVSDRDGIRYLVLATLDRPDREAIFDSGVIRGAFTPDGQSVVYSKRDPLVGSQLWIASARGDDEPRLFLTEEGGMENARISPDGRWIAYVGRRLNRAEVLVRAFDGGAGPWQVSRGGGQQPRWSTDGSELYFVSDDMMMAAAVRPGGTMFAAGEPVALFNPRRLGLSPLDYDPLPSGFLMVETIRGERPSEQRALILVQGWQDALGGR